MSKLRDLARGKTMSDRNIWKIGLVTSFVLTMIPGTAIALKHGGGVWIAVVLVGAYQALLFYVLGWKLNPYE